MKNGNVTDFLDRLYLGEELVFEYRDKIYFIQGWWEEESVATMVLDLVEKQDFHHYIWKKDANTMKACADAFLSTPLWEGKTFLQIQETVTWTDW